LYVSHEGLPGNTVSFVQLSKNRINFQYKLLISGKKVKTRLGILHLMFWAKLIRKKSWTPWTPFSRFSGSFSCTILTKDFPETGSKLPELPGFYSGGRRTRGANIPAHLPAMNPNKYSWPVGPQETMDKRAVSIAGAGWVVAEKGVGGGVGETDI
jgi:hypothetical protein